MEWAGVAARSSASSRSSAAIRGLLSGAFKG